MAFLDSASAASDDAEDKGPPQPQGPGGPPGGAPGGPPGGGGPILAAIANRQRGPQVSAPGPGDAANGMSLVMQAYGFLKQALPSLMPGSPIETDVLKITQRLARHLPQGQPAAGVQQTQIQDLLRNSIKNMLLQKIMSQMKPGQAGGPAGAGPPGAMAQAPMPSTPLPGA